MTKHHPARHHAYHQPACHRRDARRSRVPLAIRLAAFGAVVLAVVGLAAWQLRPVPAAGSADRTVRITMAGFQPANFVIPRGRETTVLLVNPDSSHHTDGGGVHQFAVPALGVDVTVQPTSSLVLTIAAAAPGRYAFYCDTCCGGKENPSMQGILTVE
jgi:cytochrome c oxidase subunit 2